MMRTKKPTTSPNISEKSNSLSHKQSLLQNVDSIACTIRDLCISCTISKKVSAFQVLDECFADF